MAHKALLRKNLWLVGSLLQILILQPINAQSYRDSESQNIRIDPEWVKTYEAGDFIWAYDVVADRDGNTYSTGYFKRNLKIAERKWIEPTTPCYSRCPDTYFIMKHDSNGNLIWVNYGNGNSRPARVAIDHSGYIWVVGNDYGTSTEFTSIDENPVKLQKPEGTATAVFALRYTPQGNLINAFMVPGSGNFDVNDLRIDEKGSYILAGSYQFRNYDNRSEVRRSFLVMKFNPDFSPAWELRGDTIGQSNLQSAYSDLDGNIYLTGGFNKQIRLGTKGFSTKGYDAIAFAMKISPKGKIEWALDSLGAFRIGAGKGIVCDDKGNAFLITTSGYSITVLSKINKKGRLEWSHTIKGKASNYHERLLIDEQNDLYLCGEGYGTTFNSFKTEPLSYKTVGGTDFYFAKYNGNGDLIWLKAGGGKGTDYCKSITLSQGKLIAFGWFGGEMGFRDTLLKSRSGYVFWLAQFDQKTLESNDILAPKPLSVTKQNLTDTLFDEEQCTCSHYREPKKTVFFPSLEPIASYDEFKIITGWQLLDRTGFNMLFFRDLQHSTGGNPAFYSLKIMAFRQPVRLINQVNTFGINLTPCTNDPGIFELPIAVQYEHPIKRHDPDFDLASFDHTAKAYLAAFLSIAGTEEEELKEYGLYEQAMSAVAQNDLGLLEEVFMSVSSDMSLDIIKGMINPSVRATFDITRMGIDISPSIIRKWDVKKNKPATDPLGFPAATNILARVASLEYSYADGIIPDLISVCASASEISNTGMLINFSEAVLFSTPMQYPDLIDFNHYPFFMSNYNSGNWGEEPSPESEYKMDAEISQFTGLYLTVAQLDIPLRNRIVRATGERILINNNFIAGAMIIPAEDATEFNSVILKVKIKTNDDEIVISLAELEEYFHLIGIRDVLLHMQEGSLVVVFRKQQ
jgi:hypothetical protein